ncbi:YkvA family protein [Aquibacillus saliphilus]|uniref:YkvA family protein n=1 Tax=Aquibacillus saliphilus TaxID=1909422 RepID=UPI001CEFD5FF|nr:YkvA family protein [Aquibacillus saliphilus]
MFEKFRNKKKNNLDLNQEELDIEEFDIDDSKVEELKFEAENMDDSRIQEHEKYYSEDGLWKKIQKISKKAGSTAVYTILILYYTMLKPEVPYKLKATIAGALGYFILPLDLIPDVALGAGFIDDLAVLSAALYQIAMYVDDDIKKQAKDKLIDLFGEGIDTSGIDDTL